MIPQQFTLSGALGIKAGLNRDSITMDFSSIPSEAVTIALRGDNGQGKSTIMNLGLHPFRIPPHIDDIYSHFGETGLRELEFLHGDHLFKSVITIKQTAKTKSMSAMLLEWAVQAWVPVRTLDGTVSDGKNGTYDKCLEFVLGPKSIYFMSAFKCQNAKPLADHDDPKSLMRDLLSLDEPDQLSVKSNEVAKALKQQLESKRDEIKLIQEREEQLTSNQYSLETLKTDLPRQQETKQECVDKVADAKTAYETARNADADIVELKKQHSELNKQLTDIKSEHDLEVTRNGTRITTIERRIKTNKELIGCADDVKEAERVIPLAEKDLESLNASLTVHRGVKIKLTELNSDLRNLRTEQANVTKTGKALAENYANIERRSKFVEQVPCNGQGEFSECPALKEAIEAGSILECEQKKIEQSRSEWSKIDAAAKELLTEITRIGHIDTTIAETEEQISQVNINLSNIRQTASKRAALDQAQSTIDEANTELEDAVKEKAAITEKFNLKVSDIKSKIEALPPIDQDDQLEHAGKMLKQAETDLTVATTCLERCISDIAKFESSMETLKKQLESADSIKQEVKRIGDELATWKLLTLALKGVIDLSIEDAGPAISNIANRLLLDAYGPRFTLNIITQKLQNNGVLKETFDISVIDSLSEIESSITKKSGGETVWLDKALTDAVALYHKEAANTDYECMFADEAEDGLTNDRKEQLYKMDRAALSLGGYKRKFFISHNPSAWQMADHVIDLSEFKVA